MTNATKATMIRPGLMVALKTRTVGGITYQRKDLDANGVDAGLTDAEADTKDVTRWETTKVVDDPAELERATKELDKAIKGIRKHCARTSFGLLCPESAEAELDSGIIAARAIVDGWNAGARYTHIHVYVLKGRITADDAMASRAIAEDVRSMIEAMNAGIDKLDVKAIRDAADRAREMGTMLAPEQQEKVSEAVTAARKAARDIVRRVEKGAEDARVVLADIQRGAIERARMTFLDLDAPAAPADGQMPAVNVQRVAGLDLATADDQPTAFIWDSSRSTPGGA